MTSPTPRRAERDTPRPHNRGGGHSYDRCDELFDSFHSWAVGIKPPRPAGTPPLEGWRLAAGVVRECGFIHLLSCHSRAGGNRAWVVNNYLILGIIQRYIFYLLAIHSTNLIDPIPALTTPQIHSYLWGPRARE